jgi:hypothetical protein
LRRVRAATLEIVTGWWSGRLGQDAEGLWHPGRTVVHGDGGELVVARRGDAVHVVVPDWAGKKVRRLAEHGDDAQLLTRKWWLSSDLVGGHTVRRPLVHAYADIAPSRPKKVEDITAGDVAGWRDLVRTRKWEASGFGLPVRAAYGVRSNGHLAAASNRTDFLGRPVSVGVLTHPKYRGKGLSSSVARAATHHAVTDHGFARMLCELEDVRGGALVAALGFEAYCDELVIA